MFGTELQGRDHYLLEKGKPFFYRRINLLFFIPIL
jgi:hypothetical protein